MNLPLRVASRYKLAGFIPDKFWREQKAALKAILTKPIKYSSGIHEVAWALRNDLISFYKRFAVALSDMGLGPAEDTVRDRTENVIHVITKVTESLDKFEREVSQSYPWPQKLPEEQIALNIALEIEDYFKEKVKTPLIAMKALWQTDHRLIQSLAKRILKKATPTELAALEDQVQNQEDFGRPSAKVRFDFYTRVGLKAQARKLVSKEEITYDPVKWMDFLREVLIANYTGEAAERLPNRNFDLHGMKVIVDDSTVTDDEMNRYIKYLKEAYEALRRKGFAKVWYGTVFIQCASCGGVNYNDGGGVGGNYPIGRDVVNIFSRPSSFIVELMAHELGHRFWFKQMTESQRARFESLVKAYRRPKPQPGKPLEIPLDKVREAHTRIDAEAAKVQAALQEFRTAMFRAKMVNKALREKRLGLEQAGSEFGNRWIDALQSSGADSSINPQVKAIYEEALDGGTKIRKMLWDSYETLNDRMLSEPEPTDPVENPSNYWSDVIKRLVPAWLREVGDVLNATTTAGHRYIDMAVKAFNEEENARGSRSIEQWQREVDTDDRPVAPVSNYGKSNIDEAFAEAFMHFICEMDMNQDQIESFRAVLKTAAERVLERAAGVNTSHEPLRVPERDTSPTRSLRGES